MKQEGSRLLTRESVTIRRMPPSAIAGIGSVSLLLMGGRWGNYIGVYPIFLSDVLLLLAFVNYFAGHSRQSSGRLRLRGSDPLIVVMEFALVWVFVRFAFGSDFGSVALRDAVPYFYISVGVLSWQAARSCSREAVNRSISIVCGAIGLHAVWHVMVTLFVPGLPSLLPLVSGTQNLHVFEPRVDFDGTITGVAGGLLLRSLLVSDSRKIPKAVGALLCWMAVVSGSSRASLLSTVLVAGVVIFCFMTTVHDPSLRMRRRRLLVALGIPVVVLTSALLLPFTNAGARLVGGFLPSQQGQLAEGAAGSQTARSLAWRVLFRWIYEEPLRMFAGIGFGPNFMVNSGASQFLIGTLDEGADITRSPHMYWLGTLARTGVVGTCLVLVASIVFVLRVWSSRERLVLSRETAVVALIPLAMLVPATLGVILESPFGAVPYWWCLGVFAALAEVPREEEYSAFGAVREGFS